MSPGRTDEEPGSRFANFSKNLILLLTTLALLLVVLEIGVRVLTDVPPTIGVRDPVIGKKHHPNFAGKVFVDEAGREVFLRFNGEGFRGPEVPYRRAPDARRIAVLGDSFVAAIASDEDQTAVGVLGTLFGQSHPEVRWEVQNFGVSGSSTGQQLKLYREIVSRYHPDIVLCAYFMGNDFTDNSNRLSNNPRIYFELDDRGELVQVPFSATRSKVSAWLNLHSRFYVWQKRANDLLQGRHDKDDRIYSTARSEILDATWELNERLIFTLATEVERGGARFVLVLLPDAAQVYDDVWEAILDEAGEHAGELDPTHAENRLASFARDQGIAVVTMTGDLRQAAGGGRASDTGPDELLFFAGVGHFTARGNRLAATAIHRFLTEEEGREILASVLADGAGP